MRKKTRQVITQLRIIQSKVASQLFRARKHPAGKSRWERFRDECLEIVDFGQNSEACCDLLAQAIVVATVSLQLTARECQTALRGRLVSLAASPMIHDLLAIAGEPEAHPELWTPSLLAEMLALSREVRMVCRDEAAIRGGTQGFEFLYFYEVLLSHSDPAGRRRRGVYYTPQPLANYIVRSIDHALRCRLDFPAGLATIVPWERLDSGNNKLMLPPGVQAQEEALKILDPATGTGVFLVEVIDVVHKTMDEKWQQEGHSVSERAEKWSFYVVEHLLPRLVGNDILLPASVVAHLAVAVKLYQTGFDFRSGAKARIYLTNSLQEPTEEVFSVILGNPPFSALSTNGTAWIDGLLRGESQGTSKTANYYECDGKPLGERKLWLKDDYVRFLRLAQWHIDRAGFGVAGMVTNHGYLDNQTFRGMRQQLGQTFSHVEVTDLHGSRKSPGMTLEQGTDENIFAIETGVAVSIFQRPIGKEAPTTVGFCEAWGARAKKLALLEEPLGAVQPRIQVVPVSPFYFYVPGRGGTEREYDQAFPIDELMPIHTTAPVTARDRLVVAFDDAELIQRIESFLDLRIPDEQIREEMFPRPRSDKYPRGDTRGWKLGLARRSLAAEPHWRKYIRSCIYRPFDRRSILWHESMIDWPRSRVMHHLTAGKNLALVTRRQMLPFQPCTFFSVVDGITLDGVLRSDNRGSESIFPLRLYSRDPSSDSDVELTARVNIKSNFLHRLESRLGREFSPYVKTTDQLISTFTPLDVLNYIYAMFFSATYRTKYAEPLRVGFPRVFLPSCEEVFWEFAALGEQLIQGHLLQTTQGNIASQWQGRGSWLVERGFPKLKSGNLYINPDRWLSKVDAQTWEMRFGGHHVARKWLYERRLRNLSPREAKRYRQIIFQLEATRGLGQQIETVIQRFGGWDAVIQSVS
ncbi:MAG: hypothetical protein MK165_19025 [Pirellulaceae bacterium]|nr:hypothetical protein [Pirellulaceae bacterium]